jgi:predicted molibdopterin-dependent oxidoreductase YjgC
MNLAVKTHGDPAHLIVIDPHWNLLCQTANIWLRPKPGTDGALLNGMAKYILDEGLANEAFLADRAEGLEDWKASLADFTIERVSRVTGCPADDIRQAARLYATGGNRKEGDGWHPSAAFFGNGLTQHRGGVDNVLALNNLAIITGNVGREFAGVNTYVGDSNTQGSGDMGVAPDHLPGWADLGDAEARARFEELWLSRWTPGQQSASLPTATGLTLTELPDALESGRVRALWVQGGDLIGTAPNPERMQGAIERAEFLVVQSMFRNATAELADVILPMVSGYEKDGTYTNLERRVQRVRQAIPPIAGNKTDWQFLIDLMRRFGYDLPYRHPSQIMDEIATMVPHYAGINYRRIDADGLHWPVPAADHPGTPTMHLDGFATPSGKAQLVRARYVLSADASDQEYPLILQIASSLYHWETGEQTRRSVGPRRLEPDPVVEIGVQDAAHAGLNDGDLVRVTSRRGVVEVRARVSERLPAGNIRLFPHWPGVLPVGRLVGEATDMQTGTPELKHIAVNIARIDAIEQAAD